MTCLSLPLRMPQRSHQRRMTCSWAIPPQWPERWPGYRSPLPKAMSPRTAKPCNRSHPPLCINEVLHMSPLNSLNGRRRKKEDLGTTGQMPRQDQASLVIMSLYYCTCSCNGGGVGSICSSIRQLLLLNYIVTPDLSSLCDYCRLFL